MFILLYFLLASGDLLLLRFVELSPNLPSKKRVVEIARTIESQTSRRILLEKSNHGPRIKIPHGFEFREGRPQYPLDLHLDR